MPLHAPLGKCPKFVYFTDQHFCSKIRPKYVYGIRFSLYFTKYPHLWLNIWMVNKQYHENLFKGIFNFACVIYRPSVYFTDRVCKIQYALYIGYVLHIFVIEILYFHYTIVNSCMKCKKYTLRRIHTCLLALCNLQTCAFHNEGIPLTETFQKSPSLPL